MESSNDAYYRRPSPGRTDYWRKMAAPRLRARRLLAELGREPAGSAVDLGCGGGELLAEVRARFPALRLCGVDASEAQMAENRRREPGLDWLTADLDRPVGFPPALAGSFDAVLASEVVEHVESPGSLLANALLLARSGGRLLLSTQTGPVGETERAVGHLRHFTAAEMTALMGRSGWEPLRVWNEGFPFHDLSKRLANLRPAAAMSRFGGEAYGHFEQAVCLALRLAFRLNSRSRGAQLFAVARKP
ncbi:MAG: class I SAM-dependent methyltransferase [Elusimicrobia bacterium]|nr:class I SAM-dependent methyltransferase [Elusimicrobiota bacterium]